MPTMTLRELVEQHPDWLDLEMAVLTNTDLEFVGASATVYKDVDDDDNDIIVFTGN